MLFWPSQVRNNCQRFVNFRTCVLPSMFNSLVCEIGENAVGLQYAIYLRNCFPKGGKLLQKELWNFIALTNRVYFILKKSMEHVFSIFQWSRNAEIVFLSVNKARDWLSQLSCNHEPAYQSLTPSLSYSETRRLGFERRLRLVLWNIITLLP